MSLVVGEACMTVEQRCESYAQSFPDAHKIVNGRIYGVWVMGNSYQNKTDFYGEFPHSVLERILALFPDKKDKILHLFAGTLKAKVPKVITYDMSPRFKPTIRDDVANIIRYSEMLGDRSLVICDPPYDATDAEKYGFPPCNKKKVLKDLHSILKNGAVVAWLDTRKPMYRKDEWHLMGEIMVSVSTMHRYRGLCLFSRL